MNSDLIRHKHLLEKATPEFVAEQERLAANLVDLYHPRIVLHLGCGLGVLVNELHKKGVNATGYDDNAENVVYHLKHYQQDNVKLHDVGTMSFNHKADLVVMTGLLERLYQDQMEFVFDQITNNARLFYCNTGRHPKEVKEYVLPLAEACELKLVDEQGMDDGDLVFSTWFGTQEQQNIEAIVLATIKVMKKA